MKWWGWIPFWLILWFFLSVVFRISFEGVLGLKDSKYWGEVAATVGVLVASALVHGTTIKPPKKGD